MIKLIAIFLILFFNCQSNPSIGVEEIPTGSPHCPSQKGRIQQACLETTDHQFFLAPNLFYDTQRKEYCDWYYYNTLIACLPTYSSISVNLYYMDPNCSVPFFVGIPMPLSTSTWFAGSIKYIKETNSNGAITYYPATSVPRPDVLYQGKPGVCISTPTLNWDPTTLYFTNEMPIALVEFASSAVVLPQ